MEGKMIFERVDGWEIIRVGNRDKAKNERKENLYHT